MITANFNAYNAYVTDSLYQWDINQVLTVSGLNISVVPEVHFSNGNMDRAIVRQAALKNGAVTVDIPNSVLQSPLPIYAHIGIYEGSTFKVIEYVIIPVIPRTRPADYQIEDSDEEIYSFKALENALVNKADNAVVNARIDNIIAHNNDTEGNTELIDIRTGVKGEIYTSAGEAVRSQIAEKANAIDINHFYSLDIIKRYFDSLDNLYPAGDIILDYGGNAWAFTISDSFTLPLGTYTIFIPNMPVDTTVTVEYVGGSSDQSLRILQAKDLGVYCFEVERDDLNLELRFQVTTSDTKTEGIYGVYDIAIVNGDHSSKTLIPETITGVDKKLNLIRGKNLFDKNSSEITYGKYLDYIGGEMDNEAYYTSGFISVKPSTAYVLHDWKIGGAYVVFYTEGKGVLMDYSIQGNAAPVDSTFTTPDNCYYIRLTGRIENININQLEEGTIKTSYEPYTEYAPLQNVETRVSFLEKNVLIPTVVKYAEIDTLSNGEYITLGENIDVKKNKTLTFFAKVSEFNSLRIGHGEMSYGGSYIDISNDSIEVYSYTTTATNTVTKTHGLTISKFITVVIDVNITATITLFTASGSYTISDIVWEGCNGSIFAKNIESVLTDCELKWISSDLFADIWVFGDSYLGLTNPARYPHYLLSLGFEKWLACGYPGAGTDSQRLSFENLLSMKTPKVAVWGMGMNNADNTAINSTWLNNTSAFISLCEANNIIPVLATIPNVPTRNHSYKNAWVKNSGYRYIDFEKAVGSDENNSWYDGMLSGDGVHPNELGAKALASRFIIDVPEIAQK